MTKTTNERPHGPQGVDTLVTLVRKTFTDELSPREQFGVLRVEQAWQAARAPRRWNLTLRPRMLAAALALALAVPGGLLAYRHLARVQFQVVNGAVADDGRIVASGGETAVVFSEGSRLDVGAAARARVASTSPDGGRVVVDDGLVRADIVHRPRARWTVDAGPYSIRVTGTAFDVQWSAADERLDFRMTRGSVVVTGPLIQDGVTLTAGMRLTARPRVGQLAIGEGTASASAAAESRSGRPAPAEAPLPAAATPAPAERPALPELTTREERRGMKRHEHGWDRYVAEGAFPTVVAEAESAGLDQVLAGATGKDLAALSDAARYTHHTGTAWRALQALRARFPRAGQSRDAAFFLGGLAESDDATARSTEGRGAVGQHALDWYNRYLRECPTGRFIGEAWGRKMVLTQKQRGVAAARPIAEEYLHRFPSGPYVAAARKLVQAPE